MLTDENIKRMKASADLLPPPGGEVVLVCLAEIDRLKELLKEASDEIVSRGGLMEWPIEERDRICAELEEKQGAITRLYEKQEKYIDEIAQLKAELASELRRVGKHGGIEEGDDAEG